MTQELLSNPAVQGGVAPFVVALLVALVLARAQLAGLAVLAAFLTCTYFVAGFQLTPLTALRKVLLVVVAAGLLAVLLDFAFRPTRVGFALVAVGCAAASLWAFGPVIATRPGAEAWRLGAVVAVSVAFMVGFSMRVLASDGVRAGAAALGTGLGVGVAAIIGASASLGLQGISLGAGAGAFLLPQMIRGKKAFAGATLTLPAMLIGALLACAAMVLAELPWHAVLVLAAIPAVAALPLPRSAPAWAQAVLCTLYTLVVAGAACALAWPASQ
ncbi:MAG TPA: hypothetical protein VM489_18120 [Burkholderiales bacterium]|nr:hypothetical protein [Burkholderiales bacterium]